jgi:hypothetical protein
VDEAGTAEGGDADPVAQLEAATENDGALIVQGQKELSDESVLSP